MTRSIFNRGDEWPLGVPSVLVYDSNIRYDASKPQGGLDWQLFQHQCFPWLSNTDEGDVELRSDKEFLMSMPDENGDEKPVRIIPSGPIRQISINNEMSSIVWRQYWADYGLPDLARVMRENGVDFIRLEAHPTPRQHEDDFTTSRDYLTVKTVNYQQRTVTFYGKKYYRKRVTSALNSTGAPKYDIGNHWGFQRYMRDQLTSDAERQLDEFKVHEYNYGFMTRDGVQYRYSRIVDSPERDYKAISYHSIRSAINRTDADGNYIFAAFDVNPLTGQFGIVYTDGSDISFDLSLLKVANQAWLEALDLAPASEKQDRNEALAKFEIIEATEVAPSEHVVHFDTMPPDLAPGEKMVIIRRLPYVTTMLATVGNLSQKGGFWDFRVRFDRKRRQFSAVFLWTNYLESFIRRYPSHEKSMEIDVKEFPGATTPFMNTHRPRGGMLNYAQEQGLTPVMNHPEWTEEYKQQHQLLIPIDSPDYVDSGAWHDIRVAIGYPGNPIGLPDYSVAWYERVATGRFKFTCGCVLSPDAYSDALDHLQAFICNPVDGDFVADMEYFAPNRGSDNEELPITFDIAHIKLYQWHGFEPGGAGLPDFDGLYPNGMRPTPNDTKGSTGGPTTGAPPASGEKQTIISGYTEETLRNDGGKLLLPEIE